MATKLKNMRLTSVDLVRNGANQEADICLFKSADPAEATESPTERETNIFKRFINWLRENPTEGENEPENPIEKADDQPDLADIYKSAITESLQSIAADESLSAAEKNDMIAKSLGEYHDAMLDLFGFEPEDGLAKSDEDEDEVDDEEVEKANPYHDALGRFTTGGGGGVRRRNIDEETDEILAIERELAGSRSPGSSGSGNRLSDKVRSCVGTTTSDMLSAWEKINQSAGNTLDTDRTTKTKEGTYKIPSKTKYGPSVIASISENHSTGKCTINSVVVGKSAADIDEIEEVETVEKFNENHDPATGRFAPKGGGGSLRGSDVRNFGVPGHSGSYSMNKKEKKLARQIIETEELELEVKDSTDAYGNKMTVIHGSREDYATFKDVWGMVAPSLKKSADFDEIEEV